MQVDGTQFPRPVWVGDPGAKSVQDDDKVIIELIRFPSTLQDGEGVIVEILGAADAPGVDTHRRLLPSLVCPVHSLKVF